MLGFLFSEANVLVPIDKFADGSLTPASKSDRSQLGKIQRKNRLSHYSSASFTFDGTAFRTDGIDKIWDCSSSPELADRKLASIVPAPQSMTIHPKWFEPPHHGFDWDLFQAALHRW